MLVRTEDARNKPVSFVHHVAARRNVVLVVVLAVIALTGVAALVFGPARGARNDIHHTRAELAGTNRILTRTLQTSRTTLARTTAVLHSTESALTVSRQGLMVAQTSEQLAGTTTANTTALVQQTSSTLATVRQVLTALGPLQKVDGDLTTIVNSVNAGLALARTTLTVARQTLSTGQAALSVAVSTLATLRRSAQIQGQLLTVARQTLNQVRQINGKLPTIPVLSSPAATSSSDGG